MIKKENKKRNVERESLVIACLIVLSIFSFATFVTATPTGPNGINVTANETKAASAAQMIDIAGGIISKINITASVQNPHWKAFVGWIDGRFTLDDSSGSTIYDWSLTSIGGEVYATRASATPNWATIECADATQIEAEDTALEQSGEDNISSTFTDDSNSGTFVVAGTAITAGTCAALNTYVNNVSQSSDFEEVILYDTTNSYTIFTTILEEDTTGYDGSDYDFQMLIPENGSETWSSSTPYYLYVELS